MYFNMYNEIVYIYTQCRIEADEGKKQKQPIAATEEKSWSTER